jgi:Protein of unknown function (DUF1559)
VLSMMQFAKLKLAATMVAGVVGLTGVATIIGVSAAPQEPVPVPAAKKEAPLVAKPAEKPPLIADAKQRALSKERIKKIVLACHEYHEANGSLPSDVLDKNGKPLLSWRVLILPYLEQNNLYRQFKLDEPWDSEHNKQFSATILKAYSNGHEPTNTKYPMTFFQRPTGKGTAHEPGFQRNVGNGAGAGGGLGGLTGAGGAPGAVLTIIKGVCLTDITDGLSNTIFLIEAEKAAEWAKPDDLAFDLQKPVDIRGPFANVIHVAFADGFARSFAGGIDKTAAKWMIGRAEGEPFQMDQYRGSGWAGGKADEAKEAAELLKQLEEQTAELKKLMAENHQRELDILKTNRERVQGGNITQLAYWLLELDEKIQREQQRKRQLDPRLKKE